MDHEYAPIDGLANYRQKCLEVAYGKDNQKLKDGRIVAIQSLSGTGSLRVGMEFMRQWYPNKDAKIFVPDPTWPTHVGIGNRAGFEVERYRYFHQGTKGLDYDGMCEDIDRAPDGSIIVMHVCAHNPTGVDPSKDQWRGLADIVTRKNHFVAFDSAYQGFASGDLDEDAFSLRLMSERTDKVCLFQSFAKNFGLYGERVGCVSFLTDSAEEAKRVQSRLKMIARPMYSNPPIHGARIVDIVLNDPELTAGWHADLKLMSGRIKDMREGLVSNLKSLGSEHDWSHITNQIGMFAFTGITKDMVEEMRDKHNIFMTMDGRISIAGLNTSNLDYVSECMHKVSHGKKI